jgi:hypothetical protein
MFEVCAFVKRSQIEYPAPFARQLAERLLIWFHVEYVVGRWAVNCFSMSVTPYARVSLRFRLGKTPGLD